jgi:hypothetical protein
MNKLCLARNPLAMTGTVIALSGLLSLAPAAQALTLVSQRAALKGNDLLDWSSLSSPAPLTFLPNSFRTVSQGGVDLNVAIPVSSQAGITPPLVFQTLPGGIETNFALGDFVLFTGLVPGPPPAIGNPGPITITFDTPVFGAGTQIAVDDTLSFIASIEAFDVDNNSLGLFSAPGTSSLALDNSAIFLGVRSDTRNISRLVFSTSVPNRAVGINALSLVTVAVPEPSSILGLLLLGALPLWGRKKAKVKR